MPFSERGIDFNKTKCGLLYVAKSKETLFFQRFNTLIFTFLVYFNQFSMMYILRNPLFRQHVSTEKKAVPSLLYHQLGMYN